MTSLGQLYWLNLRTVRLRGRVFAQQQTVLDWSRSCVGVSGSAIAIVTY